VNVKGFFVDTLSSALDLGIATPDDVIRHVTPDVLSRHLPRPLWARLLTAALGAPRVDAQLVIETIGVPNLCEHVPSTIIWVCVAEIAQRALAGVPAQPLPKQAAVTPPQMKSAPLPLAAPPPAEIKREAPSRDTPSRGTPLPPVGTNIPKPADGLADVVAALESDERQAAPSGRARSPTGPRFRQSGTGISRLGAINTRRPQAAAPAAEEAARVAAAAVAKAPRREKTEADSYDGETEVKEDWKNTLVVEDEQLVDWQASEETLTSADEYRKR
jgi:hypothetical protein